VEPLRVTASLVIPPDELRFTYDRSPGPGGQNVNKLNTRAELRFDVQAAAASAPSSAAGCWTVWARA